MYGMPASGTPTEHGFWSYLTTNGDGLPWPTPGCIERKFSFGIS